MKKIKSILLIFLFIFVSSCSILEKKKNIESNIGNNTGVVINKNIDSKIFEEEYKEIGVLDDIRPKEALKKQFDVIKKKGGKDFNDYESLVYIYNSLGDYKNIIKYGEEASKIEGFRDVIQEHTSDSIYSFLLKAYFVEGQYDKILNGDKELFDYRAYIIYYYLKNDIDNIKKIMNDDIAGKEYFQPFDKYVLAKLYLKKGDNINAENLLLELYNFGKERKEKEYDFINDIFLYLSSEYLTDIYKRKGDIEKYNFYNSEFKKVKEKIYSGNVYSYDELKNKNVKMDKNYVLENIRYLELF